MEFTTLMVIRFFLRVNLRGILKLLMKYIVVPLSNSQKNSSIGIPNQNIEKMMAINIFITFACHSTNESNFALLLLVNL